MNLETRLWLLKQSCINLEALLILWSNLVWFFFGIIKIMYAYIHILPFFDGDSHYQANSFWHHQNLHDLQKLLLTLYVHGQGSSMQCSIAPSPLWCSYPSLDSSSHPMWILSFKKLNLILKLLLLPWFIYLKLNSPKPCGSNAFQGCFDDAKESRVKQIPKI